MPVKLTLLWGVYRLQFLKLSYQKSGNENVKYCIIELNQY